MDFKIAKAKLERWASGPTRSATVTIDGNEKEAVLVPWYEADVYLYDVGNVTDLSRGWGRLAYLHSTERNPKCHGFYVRTATNQRGNFYSAKDLMWALLGGNVKRRFNQLQLSMSVRPNRHADRLEVNFHAEWGRPYDCPDPSGRHGAEPGKSACFSFDSAGWADGVAMARPVISGQGRLDVFLDFFREKAPEDALLPKFPRNRTFEQEERDEVLAERRGILDQAGAAMFSDCFDDGTPVLPLMVRQGLEDGEGESHGITYDPKGGHYAWIAADGRAFYYFWSAWRALHEHAGVAC